MNNSQEKWSGIRLGKADAEKILIAISFIVMVFLPLFRMFANINVDNICKVVESPIFVEAALNSLKITITATVITLIIAFLLALCTERVDIKFKNLFILLFILPMLIPSISHGMGLILLFGNNGIMTNLLGLNTGIYGFHGIVIGLVFCAFPVAYLMIADIMKYEDSCPYEAACVLGISPMHRFMKITFPYLRKPLISVVFAIFSMVLTDYGVPLMVGGKYTTLSVVMYQEVIGQLNFGKGAVYGGVLLIPAVIAFLMDLLNKDKANSCFVGKPFELSKNRLVKSMAYIFCSLISLFTLFLISSFLVLAFAKKYPYDLSVTLDNIIKTLQLKADEYLLNSLVIALLASAIGVMLAFLTAYMSARMKSKTSRFLHLSAITSTAIPGVVLGLSYVLAFKGSILYGTIAILVMVNIVHFMASPYLMMYNSLSKLNENLESVGSTLGIRRTYMIRDVFLPACKDTLFEMFAYFFVNCMMTISAVSFLATTANKPVALMINQFEAQLQMECAAVVSLAILAVNLTLKGIIILLHRCGKNKKEFD